MHPGQLILNRYLLDRELGVGGMGVVWLARDQELDCLVAMKRARAVSADGGDTMQLEVEADFAGRVQHTNIVMVHGVVGQGEDKWLVMEYFAGRSLAEIMAAETTVRVRRAIHFGRQLAEGLDAVHRAEVVHGDVKPANILINDSGMVKLSDFGISRRLWSKETLTSTGPVRGTPAYMAPEVLDERRPTPASDVFSLGATLFAAVEGVPPFGPEGAMVTMLRRVALAQQEPMRNAGPLAPLLASMLAVDPAERPTMASVKNMLRTLQDNPDTGPQTVLPPPTPDEPAEAPSPGSPWKRIALAAGLVVLVAAGVTTAVVLTRGQSAATPSSGRPVVLANQRQADPCGLTSVKPVARYGDAELDPHYAGFSRCDVIVQTNDYDVDVQTYFQSGSGSAPAQPGAFTRDGSVGVGAPVSSTGSCLQTIQLADNVAVVVNAEQDSDNGSPDLCGMAKALTGYAVGVINRSGVPQRQHPFQAASLANLNACSLLTATNLAAVPGVDATQPDPGFGDWQCNWYGPSNTEVSLVFDQGQPLDSSDGQEVPIGSHAAFVSLDSGDCEADLVDRTYTTQVDGPISEVVNVVVAGSQPQSQQCDMAETLAGDIVGRLPS